MNKAPLSFSPGAKTFYNGGPTWHDDPRFLDMYQTWLATVWRPAQPVIMGGPWHGSSDTFKWRVRIPPYTEWVLVEFLATGIGALYFTSGSDPYNSKVDVYVPGVTMIDQAKLHVTMSPWDAPDQNGENKPLKATFSNDWQTETYTMSLYEGDPTFKLQVWSLRVIPLPPLPETALI